MIPNRGAPEGFEVREEEAGTLFARRELMQPLLELNLSPLLQAPEIFLSSAL